MNSKELQAALDAAEAAATVIRSLYQRNLAVHTKADATPVTEADVKAEEAIRAILTERFPTYGFYGEETGQQAMDAENLWLVDPIDGTKSFVRECPFFSTQIALMRKRPAGAGRVERAGVRRAGVGGRGRGRASERPAHSREPDGRACGRDRFDRQPEDAGAFTAMGEVRRARFRASAAFGATATSCTTTCWRAVRSMWSSSRT